MITQDDLERLANNPERGINMLVADVEKNQFNGTVTLNSKAHPAILAYDLILGTTHAFFNRLSDAVSKTHLKHARNVNDLSRNMGDEERFGLFAMPSSSSVQMGISETAFMDVAKDVTVVQGKVSTKYKKLLIPKDTVLDVNGYPFATNNGVEIRWSEKAGWQAVFDEETNNPFSPIGTNLVQKGFKLVNGTMYRLFTIPVQQLSITATENITANVGSGCMGRIEYKDYLYGVRAFLIKNGVQTEIDVTYDKDVFDPLKPTLAIIFDTVNNTIDYEIPDVYLNNGLGTGSLRIFTYTTVGLLEKDLRQTPATKIAANYQDYRYGSGNLSEYSAPLRNMGGIAWSMVETVTGGSDPVPFNEIKQALIDGRRSRNTPITENNLKGKVSNFGYGAVQTIDYLTYRTYSLSKELPIQSNKGFYAPMSCYVGSHLTTANDLIAAGVVFDNGRRITIPHNVLFDISTSTTKLVNAITADRYKNMTGEQLVDTLAKSTLAYTPFYYVMDMTNNQAVLRTYHLDSPKIKNQTFVAENASLGFELGVGSIAIEHVNTGYRVTIVTQSSDAYKKLDNNQLAIQLSLTPQDTNSLASVAGVLVGVTDDDERVFEFHLDSKFDVDVNDIMYFTNFNQFGAVQPNTGSTLSTSMTFIFCYVGDQEYSKTDSDAKIDRTLFGQDLVAIIETSYGVTFGKLMGNLYSRIRPLIGEAQYLRYTMDVPMTYPKNVFEYVDGQLVFGDDDLPVVKYKAGDMVYNTDGSVRLLYQRGDVVIDELGNPVEVAPRDLKYHWDFIAFDANYYFSTDLYDIEFAQYTKDYFVDEISYQLEVFTADALDRTNLFYQPRSKLGFQKVVVNSNFEAFLKQDLEFTLIYYLTATGYKDQNLKDALTASSPKVLNEGVFNKTTIGISNFVNDLMRDTPEQVVSVKLSAVAGDETVDVISNIDELAGFSIRKKLEQTGDGGLTIKESIDIIFMLHDVSTVGN